MKDKRMLILKSVLAGVQVVAGAAGLADVVGEKWAGLVVLVVGAAQVAIATYEHGLLTPVPTDTSK